MQDTDCSPAVGLGYLRVQWGTGHLHPHVSLDQTWFNPVLIFGDPRDKSWWIKCCRHCICRWASRVVWELWLMRALEIGLLLSVGAQGTIPRLALLLSQRLKWPYSSSVRGSFSPAKQLSFILLHRNMWFKDDSFLFFEPGLGYYLAFQPNIIRNVDMSTQGYFLQN